MPAEHPPKYRFHRLSALGVVLSITLAGLTSPVTAAADRILPDQAISDAIEDELMSDRIVPMAQLEIKTQAGIVTLTGTVDNLLAKVRAADIASTVKGVRSVINRIDIEPEVQPTDHELENLVAAALMGNAATEAYEIEAQVDDGVVTLTGTVDSWQEEQLAVKVARAYPESRRSTAESISTTAANVRTKRSRRILSVPCGTTYWSTAR
jgi:osmotically-inducible protein OsmY